MIKKYNIAIIGGGPAGIAAGIYGKYDGNNPIILEAKTLAWIPENHVNLLEKLEGFPGLLNMVNGTQLIERFRHSLKDMDVDYLERTLVRRIEKTNEHIFTVKTDHNTYEVEAVILATGTRPTHLPVGVVGSYTEQVYYFALDNYRQYINKDVIVLGSRNSGSTAALYLARHGVKVTILEIKPEIQAKEKHTRYFEGLGIRVVTNAKITQINGIDGAMNEVAYERDAEKLTLPASAVFCYIGITPETDMARDLGIEVDTQGYTPTNFFQQSNQPGVFIAGDMCGDLKHIIAASGQGAKAAYNVNKYLNTRH